MIWALLWHPEQGRCRGGEQSHGAIPADYDLVSRYKIPFAELLGLVALLAKPLGGLGLVLAWYGPTSASSTESPLRWRATAWCDVPIDCVSVLFLEVLGLVALLAKPLEGLGVVLAWYGLYSGILNRDAAEVASNRMMRSA